MGFFLSECLFRTPRDSRLLFPIIGSEMTIMKNKEKELAAHCTYVAGAQK